MSEAPGSRAGSMFGPYRLIRPLGRGGMGEVYEAEHTVKGWTVAVKLMSEILTSDPVFRERMKREARITGRLQEPHVVPIHDYGEIDGQMFLEMRLIEGTDLDTMLKRFGPLPAPRAVAIITQIASALDAAHADDVMHRDVKPPNILITRDDFAYLVDFGIANAATDEKLTQMGTAVGTWKYMAPERFTNDNVTHHADIYALACVLYECLTGNPPYQSDSAGMLISAHMIEPIPRPSAVRPDIPKAFDAVIARGMAKRPADRYASTGDLAQAAHQALSAPEQNQAETILRRSQEAALPGHLAEPPTIEHARWPRSAPAGAGRRPPPGPIHSSGPILSSGPSVPMRPPAAPAGQPSWSPSRPPFPPAVPKPPQRPAPSPWGGVAPRSPGAPLPQPFASDPAWNRGRPPVPPRPRNPWAIVSAIAVAILLLILIAIGLWAATKDDDNARATGQQRATTGTGETTIAGACAAATTSWPPAVRARLNGTDMPAANGYTGPDDKALTMTFGVVVK
ncbi:Serine/threonine-protein kinase PknH [Mycobacterium basiliense]|uniref:non-specific serine/threonine protein kinase n=1 Tax=Mycobacterium basiliense TaxID=2094119 RepID=A0A447GI25_9MYCO|nr:Serine/threonine-protein kinase PknH [Mycobacterium basiliense]